MNTKNRDKILSIAKIVIICTSLIGLASIIFEYGFNLPEKYSPFFHTISFSVVWIFILYQGLLLTLTRKKSEYFKTHNIEFIFSLLVITEFFLSVFDVSIVQRIGEAFNFKNLAMLYVVFAQIFIVIGLLLSGLRYNKKILQLNIQPSRLFVLSFLLTILTGAFLLMLPAATTNGSIKFIDALFTSTSAVCVTGLITVDTATYYTTFGKIIIMLLFQVGGLGLMTFTTFFALFLSGGLGIRERIQLHDLLDEENIGMITKILTYLTLITFLIELTGAISLFISISGQVTNIQEAVFISVFHSVSAFCNAGFSLFTLNLMDPLIQNNYLFITTISLLIILGGIGFPTILSYINHIKNKSVTKKIPLQTKVIVITTLFLIVGGTIVTYFLEAGASAKSFNLADKIFHSYFQSVSARTAGFNSLDFSKFQVSTSFFYLFLMFVGASPGGTGGGIKTTTFVILCKGSWAILTNKKNVTIANRTIPKEIVMRAFIKFFFSICLMTMCIFLLTIFDDKKLIDLSFEAFSAYGTVGLSRGITGALTDGGKYVIIFLMFVGRVGPLAFLFSLIRIKELPNLDLPEENISIL